MVRRRRSSLLTRMRDYPKEGKRAPHAPSRLRRALTWIVGGVAALALVGFIVMLVSVRMRPEAGKRLARGEFEILEVREDPPGFPPGSRVVATAAIEAEGTIVRVPVTADRRAGVEKGARLDVEYTWYPQLRRARVERWAVVPAETTAR